MIYGKQKARVENKGLRKIHAQCGQWLFIRQDDEGEPSQIDKDSMISALIPQDVMRLRNEFNGITASIQMIRGKALVSLEAHHEIDVFSVPLCADHPIEEGIALWRKLGEKLGLSLMLGHDDGSTDTVVSRKGRLMCKPSTERRVKTTKNRTSNFRAKR